MERTVSHCSGLLHTICRTSFLRAFSTLLAVSNFFISPLSAKSMGLMFRRLAKRAAVPERRPVFLRVSKVMKDEEGLHVVCLFDSLSVYLIKGSPLSQSSFI